MVQPLLRVQGPLQCVPSEGMGAAVGGQGLRRGNSFACADGSGDSGGGQAEAWYPTSLSVGRSQGRWVHPLGTPVRTPHP